MNSSHRSRRHQGWDMNMRFPQTITQMHGSRHAPEEAWPSQACPKHNAWRGGVFGKPPLTMHANLVAIGRCTWPESEIIYNTECEVRLRKESHNADSRLRIQHQQAQAQGVGTHRSDFESSINRLRPKVLGPTVPYAYVASKYRDPPLSMRDLGPGKQPR